LLTAAFFYSLANLGLMPSGGSATNLPIQWAVVAVALHFLLGVLLSFAEVASVRVPLHPFAAASPYSPTGRSESS
jgi:hypothetical protein